MTDVDFRCTECGECCRGFKLPLSVAEAMVWLRDGNPVEVLCEAIPWVEEPPASDLVAAFKRERSFPAMSGGLPIRVLVTLAAPLGSGCPHLLADNRCGIYERRPVVCRTYPAYANPFLKFMPEYRRCPPEAWQPGGVPLMRQGAYVPELMPLIESKNRQAVDDVPLYARVCDVLGIRKTAMSNEGYVAHSPAVADLLEALLVCDSAQVSSLSLNGVPSPLAGEGQGEGACCHSARFTPHPDPLPQGERGQIAASPAFLSIGSADWEFVSDNAGTVEAIRSCDARCSRALDVTSDGVAYLSLFPDASQ